MEKETNILLEEEEEAVQAMDLLRNPLNRLTRDILCLTTEELKRSPDQQTVTNPIARKALERLFGVLKLGQIHVSKSDADTLRVSRYLYDLCNALIPQEIISDADFEITSEMMEKFKTFSLNYMSTLIEIVFDTGLSNCAILNDMFSEIKEFHKIMSLVLVTCEEKIEPRPDLIANIMNLDPSQRMMF